MIAPIFLSFCSAVLFAYFVVPALYRQVNIYNQKRKHQLSAKLEHAITRRDKKQVLQLYMIAPVALAGVLYMVFPEGAQIVGAVIGVIGGLIFPSIYTRMLTAANKKKFADQLIDALMIMSSSFRGGLSLMQSMEAVVEEMPDPIKQEFSTVLGENKMGVSLEESLGHLYNRMPSAALQQMTTAILLARETGGNLPAIFQRIVGVIRQRKRIQGQIDTLTIQGKIQGVIMSLLPLGFFSIVSSTNPGFFKIMLTSPMGRMALIYALVSWVIGSFLIWKVSSIKDY